MFAEKLPVDNFSHHVLSGQRSFSYNGKLHLANITTRLFDGYSVANLAYYRDYNGVRPEPTIQYLGSQIGTTLSTSDNSENLLSPIASVGVDLSFGDYGSTYSRCVGLSPIICYPDYRATRMKIKASTIGLNSGGSAEDAYKEFALKKHPFLNIAYYQEPNLSPIKLESGSTAIGDATKGTELSPNKIRVSAVNNPFVFPVEQTYMVSNSAIKGMCAATTALSQGLSGMFPLYVFTEEGIYALSVGTGNVAYSTIQPVTRDVAKGGITSIDNAVVFATETDIRILQGGQVSVISKALDGYLPSSIVQGSLLKRIIEIPNNNGAYPHLSESDIPFRDYIDSAEVGFVYETKEIIVSNPKKDYSYVYGMSSGAWHKRNINANGGFLNAYPKCLYVKDNAAFNPYNPSLTVNDIAIISRPIKLNTTSHKRILQSALRGRVHPSLSDVYFRGENVQYRGRDVEIFSQAGFYVLGSNDAEQYNLVAGREKINDVRDLVNKMNKSKAYKYFIIALVGGVRTDVSLNFVELIVDETYTSRLH